MWRAHLCRLLRLCVDPAGFARGPGNGMSLGPAGGRARGSARPLRGRHRGGSSTRWRGLSRPGPGSPREPWSLCAGRPHAEKGAHPEVRKEGLQAAPGDSPAVPLVKTWKLAGHTRVYQGVPWAGLLVETRLRARGRAQGVSVAPASCQRSACHPPVLGPSPRRGQCACTRNTQQILEVQMRRGGFDVKNTVKIPLAQ